MGMYCSRYPKDIILKGIIILKRYTEKASNVRSSGVTRAASGRMMKRKYRRRGGAGEEHKSKY